MEIRESEKDVFFSRVVGGSLQVALGLWSDNKGGVAAVSGCGRLMALFR